jgi:hypothetical protein
MHYLIEMKSAPVTTIVSREEAIAITERFVIPTLETCARLVGEGRIVAGGPVLGATTLTFIMDAETPELVESVLLALPLWPRTQTTITPLGSFAGRLVAARERLAALKGGPGSTDGSGAPTAAVVSGEKAAPR